MLLTAANEIERRAQEGEEEVQESPTIPTTRDEAARLTPELTTGRASLLDDFAIEPRKHGSSALFSLSGPGLAIRKNVYRSVRNGDEGDARRAFAAALAVFIREAVTRLLMRFPAGTVGTMLITFRVSGEGVSGLTKAENSLEHRRSFQLSTVAPTVDGVARRLLEMTEGRGGVQAASDYAGAVEDTFVLVEAPDIYFVPARVGGVGCRNDAVKYYPETGLTLKTPRNTPEGLCLVSAVLALTGFTLEKTVDKWGRSHKPSAKRWAASLGLELVEGPRGPGLPLSCVTFLEAATKTRLKVVATTGELLRAGSPEYPEPSHGVALGYDPDACHYGVIPFVGRFDGGAGGAELADTLRADRIESAGIAAEKARGEALASCETAEDAAELRSAHRGEVFAAGLRIGAPKVLRADNGRATVFYDLETVSGPRGECLAYAVAALFVPDQDDPEALPSSLEEWGAAVKRGRAFYAVCAEPTREKNAVTKLAGWLRWKCPVRDYRTTLSAFNGARFDHLLLLDCAHQGGDIAPHQGSLLMKGTQVLALAAYGAKTHDPSGFGGGGSLEDTCEAYRVKRVKATGAYSHVAVQNAYSRGELGTWLRENAETLELYNAFDVLALAELAGKMRVAFADVSRRVCGEAFDIRDSSTAPSFAMKMLRARQKLDGVEMPDRMDSLELDRWARGAMTAGRVQNLAGAPSVMESQPLEMVDITSSYPYVMSTGAYPRGTYRCTGGEVAGCLGLYNVEIHSQPALTILPRRVEGFPLDWTYTGPMKVVACSVDIDEIRKHGGALTVGSGIYWPESTTDLFRGYIDSLYTFKAAEDAKPKEERNAGFREAIKLALTSISGKIGERPHYTACELVQGSDAWEKFVETVRPETLEVTTLTQAVLASGVLTDVAAEKQYERRGACSPLAVFTYARARAHLYTGLEYSGGVGGPGYCDTDSCLMLWDDAQRMKRERPELFPAPGQPKPLGTWEAELGQDGCKRFTSYRIAPKHYAVLEVDGAGVPLLEGKRKVRVKGIGGRSVFVDPSEVGDVRAMSQGARAVWAEAHSVRTIKKDPATTAKAFAAWAAGRATTWLCFQGRRHIGAGESAGVRFEYILKELKAPG